MNHHSAWAWVGFNGFVLLMLALDLGVFHRKVHKIGFKEAMAWTLAWVTLAVLFSIGVYYFMGHEPALQFLTGYIIEKSLSVDNIFVILMIFTYFRVPDKYQHKVLFWGILGALVMRAIFIVAGVALIERYHSIIYIFGAFLVFSGIKMALPQNEEPDLKNNLALKLLGRILPLTSEYDSAHFMVKKKGRTYATPLLATLVMVEVTDLIFAVDSIPAVLSISSDTFIVYTSNVFAILGLRSLYFAVSGLMAIFHHLKYGLTAILVFVGAKMLLTDIYKIPTLVALGVIVAILCGAIFASLLFPEKTKKSSKAGAN